MRRQILQNTGIYSGDLILVNQRYVFNGPKKPDMASVINSSPEILINRRAAILLSELMKKIHGWNRIVPVSGWRSRNEQQSIWDSTLAKNGLAFTKKFVAAPGHSEHQTGLAIDLGLKKDDVDFICPDFPYDGVCEIFRSNAASYGFIERYPFGKETVTGIGHEPWHFRYVGVPHAVIMEEYNFTLEEYTDFLKNYPYGDRPFSYRKHGRNVEISYLKAAPEGDTPFETEINIPYSVSGNNIDGFIITAWRETNGY